MRLLSNKKNGSSNNISMHQCIRTLLQQTTKNILQRVIHLPVHSISPHPAIHKCTHNETTVNLSTVYTKTDTIRITSPFSTYSLVTEDSPYSFYSSTYSICPQTSGISRTESLTNVSRLTQSNIPSLKTRI